MLVQAAPGLGPEAGGSSAWFGFKSKKVDQPVCLCACCVSRLVWLSIVQSRGRFLPRAFVANDEMLHFLWLFLIDDETFVLLEYVLVKF